MEKDNKTKKPKSVATPKSTVKIKKQYIMIGAALLIASVFVNGALLFRGPSTPPSPPNVDSEGAKNMVSGEDVMPEHGVALPVKWGNLGQQMVETGVIDQEQFELLYENRGGLDESSQSLLSGIQNDSVVMTPENTNVLLNLLWAFGLSNKNPILEEGPMSDPQYGGADRFASTGGWPLSKGSVMDHYSTHRFVNLTDAQQALVEEVSKNIYRPCCGNSVHFPDCNHGMAMLGLLELMAANNVSEQEMYDTALAVNSFWFPDTYMTLAQYFQERGVAWSDVDSKTVLGEQYSGAAGYQQILAEVQPQQAGRGASCGV